MGLKKIYDHFGRIMVRYICWYLFPPFSWEADGGCYGEKHCKWPCLGPEVSRWCAGDRGDLHSIQVKGECINIRAGSFTYIYIVIYVCVCVYVCNMCIYIYIYWYIRMYTFAYPLYFSLYCFTIRARLHVYLQLHTYYPLFVLGVPSWSCSHVNLRCH